MWFVYVLECEDGSLYTGVTNNLAKRFSAHQQGQGGHYTKSHKVQRLIYQEKLNSKSAALKREHQIKKLKRTEKKSLIRSVYMNVS